ncbi:putative zinc-ribbon domain, plant protein [Lupinus albus]|uniref:Putative zinc-ribbon domain, plant protein n=1 Tax=Lupinus albus TaxID=3870 RepID=A0A6A4NIR0_LUPAL|nr:putative zinc-ribbon domain, plant protein [Lupinus albus]
MDESGKLRLVRCPKCDNLLSEFSDYSVYQCGGCGAVLRAKHKGYISGSLSEKSDEGKIEDSAKSDSSLEKGLADSIDDTSDVDAKFNSNEKDVKKANNGHERFPNQPEGKETNEKGVYENDVDVNVNKNKVKKPIGREQEEPNSQTGHEKGSRFAGRMMHNWQNGQISEAERFWRKPKTEMESERFSTSNYPYEGTSNSHSSFSHSYAEPWRHHKESDGANKVQHLEQDRAELLRKLSELKGQLSQSSEVVNNTKKKVRLDERMIPPDPYAGSDPWFSDGSPRLNRNARQFFGTNKHVAGSNYFNYHHDPSYPDTGGSEMAMPNFHPSMHNPNHIPGYGDPFAPKILGRGPQSHQLTQQYPPKPLHPYFSGHYVNTNPDSYEPFAHSSMLHQPSCSCFHCYQNKRRGLVPTPPVPNDPMLFNHEIPTAFGPHIHNSRTAAVPQVGFREKQLHTRWPSDFNSEISDFVRSRPRKVMLATGRQHCCPIAGGSPFITCNNCFELLQLPKKALVVVKKHQQKVKCKSCSSKISIAIINKKLVVTHDSEMKGVRTRVDDFSNEVISSRVSRSHGHVNRVGANFSSDDYSGYDFHSVDREPLTLVSDLSLNSNKSEDMQSFHSSPITSEDEDSPEVVNKSIHQPTKASVTPPPAGSPLQEYLDYSSNNNSVNRFGKGNQSSRSEQEKVKTEKITTRQNSLKEAAVATEMDIRDYSNTGVSQDSGDTKGENDHPRSNKGGESFFANIIKKSFLDFSRSNQTDDRSKIDVTVNGQPLSHRVVKKAEKLSGPIQPGNYWYDFRAGFWGVMGGPCLGIIPPFIEEFNYPLPEKCSGGNTRVFVNGRELHEKDLDLLALRGLPTERDRSYIIEISGRVLDEDTAEELDSLGKLAPTVEKVKHGFGMKAPRAGP